MKKLLGILLPPAALLIAGLAHAQVPCAPNNPSTDPAEGTLTPSSPPTPGLAFVGTAPGTAADSEPDAIPGVNKNTFILHVAAGDYTGKLISVKLSWTNSANDRDLYVHKRNADGSDGEEVASSGGGAPQTGEACSFDPNVKGTGDYNVNIVYFASTPCLDQPTGLVQLINGPSLRTATYTAGGMTFSVNSPLKAPTAQQDGEPSSRVDETGNTYVCGIQGVPAGVDLWYFDLRPTINGGANPNYDPNMRAPIYKGQPDSAFSNVNLNTVKAGALGGGDIDLAVGFGNYPGDAGAILTNGQPVLGVGAQTVPVLAYASLTAANVTYGRSLDRGATFQFNPSGNLTGGVPVNDRQWMGFLDNHTVYLEYRNFAQGIAFAQRSDNGGLTYGAATLVGTLPQTGALDVDRFDGTVYISGNDGHVAVGVPTVAGQAPTSYTLNQATPPGVSVGNLFFPVRVAADHRQNNPNGTYTLTAAGTVYGVYSDGGSVYLIHSTDRGVTWSNPVKVNNPADPNLKLNLFPWLATGPTLGSVGVAWYATDSPNNNDNAKWRVYYAQTFNATSDTPTFRYALVSDHANHAANISLSGLVLTGGGPNRNLSDYFQVNFDPTGAAVVAWTDDHNDFGGFSYAARQITGPSINGGNLPTVQEGTLLPQHPFALPGALPATPGAVTPIPMQPGPNGEQVTDTAQDQDSGLLAVAPANSPLDIISIKYASQNVGGVPYITATMAVSDMTTIPPNCTWRMYFAANAPETGVTGPTDNKFSKGLSDQADQFFIQAATNAQGQATFSWGTTVRNFDGSTSDTLQPTKADSGAFNRSTKTISVRISSAKLNSYLQAHSRPTIGFGSVICGLRGRAQQTNTSGIALEDLTHGGTEFTVSQ